MKTSLTTFSAITVLILSLLIMGCESPEQPTDKSNRAEPLGEEQPGQQYSHQWLEHCEDRGGGCADKVDAVEEKQVADGRWDQAQV